MEYHPVTKKITDLLTANDCWFQTFEHTPVRTSEEAAALRPEFSLHQGAKALIVKAKFSEEKRFVMLVLPADLKFDPKKAKAILNAKDVSFATEAEVSEVTKGIQIGGVPPFGQLFGLSVFADPSLFGNEKIIFNAGDRSFSVAMLAADYKKIVQPQIAEIV